MGGGQGLRVLADESEAAILEEPSVHVALRLLDLVSDRFQTEDDGPTRERHTDRFGR